MKHPAAKIITLEAACFWRDALRRDSKTLAVTNGCFDILHAGHLQLLCSARASADALLVLVNSDASIRSLKGQSRPIIHEQDRALLLAGLSCVSAVVVFENTRCAAELAALAPDVYIKSEEYRGSLDPTEAEALAAAGSQIVYVPVADGISTSKIIEKIFATGTVPSNIHTTTGSSVQPPDHSTGAQRSCPRSGANPSTAEKAGGDFAAPRTPGDCRRAGAYGAMASTPDTASATAPADGASAAGEQPPAVAPMLNVPVAPREGVSWETASAVAPAASGRAAA